LTLSVSWKTFVETYEFILILIERILIYFLLIFLRIVSSKYKYRETGWTRFQVGDFIGCNKKEAVGALQPFVSLLLRSDSLNQHNSRTKSSNFLLTQLKGTLCYFIFSYTKNSPLRDDFPISTKITWANRKI